MRIGERAVLKTVDLRGFQGSSPWLGAKRRLKMSDFIKSIFAGICIGIAGTAYVKLGGGLFAACLFAVGLISIVLFNFNLYTGKIGYIQS